MGIVELLLLSLGLAMDAFAVSVCKGLAIGKTKLKEAYIVGAWFGVFQAIMPLIGYFLGTRFQSKIEAYDHWIAFALLVLIGINMLRESFSKDEEEKTDSSVAPKDMFLPAVATSIDALAVGIALAMVSEKGMSIFASVGIIGLTTFIISLIGVKIGGIFGEKYKNAAERVGGVILILIGLKILLEHLGIINF